jgi:CRISPR-associated protein Cas5d
MGFGVKLHVWGEYACFTRPEMKAERVSYDVMTPSAARGILDAIHWKPAIRWVIDRIHVLNPIQFEMIRRNEVKGKLSERNARSAMNGNSIVLEQVVTEERTQRNSLLLRDVAYVIEAHFELTDQAGEADSVEKHYNIFLRRARQGQCYHRPYMGCREFVTYFALLEGHEVTLDSYYKDVLEKDLGWMLWDLDYKNEMNPKFFRATMSKGIIQVPDLFNGGDLM